MTLAGPDDPQTAEIVPFAFDRAAFDVAAFAAALGDVPHVTDPARVAAKSRDYYWFSPILRPQLEGRTADLVVQPRDEAEIIHTAALCARERVPLVVRGAGSGTYGQAVPLVGGVVLDTTRLETTLWMTDHSVRAQTGARITHIDDAARWRGRELRMHPSTKRTATIGGFFAGGSGGIGSVMYGGLREPGNLAGARVVTVEETPRTIELRGSESNLVNRTFGTTGIIIEVELPLAPAYPWRDIIVAFDGFMAAARFAHALAGDADITAKLVTVLAASAASYLTPLGDAVPDGRDIVITMVDEGSIDAFQALIAVHGGQMTLNDDALRREAARRETPLYEYTWGHTTLHALRHDPTLTYLQTLFPAGRILETIEQMYATLGDEVPMHLEFIRYDGELACNGAQLLRFTSAERVAEIIAIHEAADIPVANPHVFTVEDGSRHKRVPGDQLRFKAEVDPYGLMNPGKMPSYAPRR